MSKMKIVSRILAAAAVLFLVCSSSVYVYPAPKDKTAQTSGQPAISFTEQQHNFGFIPEKGGPVTHSFEFVNTGDAPLVIISATASCGCTRPTYPTEPIAPGKSGKIKVTYLPEGRPGEFDKTVKVRTNVKESKKISLRITGTVTPDNSK